MSAECEVMVNLEGNVGFSKNLHEILAVSYSWTGSREPDVKRFFDGICSDTSRNSF